jgi:hypothetical protein
MPHTTPAISDTQDAPQQPFGTRNEFSIIPRIGSALARRAALPELI